MWYTWLYVEKGTAEPFKMLYHLASTFDTVHNIPLFILSWYKAMLSNEKYQAHAQNFKQNFENDK